MQARGREIIRKFAEANRYWLMAPPPAVRNFSYVLNRISGTQKFQVANPAKAPRARVQGVTYSTLVHVLARAPGKASVTEIVEEQGKLRLALHFEPAIRSAIGNGVENSWNGYHSFGGSDGYLVLETNRWVPLEASLGRLTEVFGEFVQVDAQHYVPLAIREQIKDTVYDWRFRLYEPGLWLFDDSFSDGRRLAWTEQVKVNDANANLRQATSASLKLAEAAKVGQARLEEFLKANRHWLLPPLEARRGLVYEYRQEAPYLERVLIDREGNLMSRQEATRESPNQPTRQALWLADGRSYRGDFADRFVRLEGGTNANANPEAWLQRDRLVQHLAMGLALDCALTRLAREPDTFWAEVRPVPKNPERYLLVLHSKGDARLFTGTMLTFSSWCYMHDVRYDRSEILCDAATHRPLEERDYDGKTDLKGSYWFENWLEAPSGVAPGQIRAVLPNQKDGKDEALEMNAQFHFAQPGVWMLERVRSHFRGSESGSTGAVTLVSATPASFQPIRELLEQANRTAGLVGAIEQAPTGSTEQAFKPGGWVPFPLQAAWTEKARESARTMDERDRGDKKPQPLLIGVYRGRIVESPAGATRVELDGLSTTSWKEFRSEWKVKLLDEQGRSLASGTTNLDLRAEGAPGPFVVQLELPARSLSPAQPQRVAVEATVQRMTGAYHGHGMWMRFARDE